MDRTFTVGVIRVLTSDDPEFVGMHGRFIEEHYPGIRCVSKCIPDQPEGIHSHELERIAVPKIVETAKSFEDVDMIIVSCADDPGVPEVRKALPGIPVTGGGETTAALALRYGEKIAVLGIVDYAPKAYLRMIAPDKLVAVGRPDGVNSTLDLMTPEGRESCFRKARELKEMGAEVIALGCTGLATIGIAQDLEKDLGIPVIDPVLAEGLFAYFEAVRRQG
ncbi:MAG TPA: aspartate/glutamate racemase family protein [Candidatus Blautia excrementipullorum]|nr:aspartate/glutamate racemase family protein [Candidatus Blautia excrementipullorum]